MTENSMKKQSVLYAVIGIMTLVVTTIGATFAYYTATRSNTNQIKGNMATITFDLAVTKMTTVDETKGGLIPMSNTMVESALEGTDTNNDSTKEICVDNNSNAVCQVYKITVSNTGTASMFLDGYVTLAGGSGTPTDNGENATNKTTMRWAQAFCDETSGTISNCTTVGKTTTGATTTTTAEQVTAVSSGITADWATLDNTSDTTGFNNTNIKTTGVTAKGGISGNPYDIINRNYIRISDHTASSGYTQSADITSALVYNEYLSAKNDTANPEGGSSATYTDSQVYYIVVWLLETGADQTATTTGAGTPTKSGLGFFSGNVTFNSAQGSEVTATFSGWTAVNPDTKPAS